LARESSSTESKHAVRSVSWTVAPEEDNLRLDRLVPAHVDEVSRAQAKRWIEQGRVSVEGKQVRPSHIVHAGERVVVEVLPAEPADTLPEAISLDIVHEDDDLLVINKPPFMVVHPAPGHRTGTLVNALLYHRPSLGGVGDVVRPGIVHRLDRGTSGLLVVAKNDRAHRRLARQFASRSVEKRYLALVHGQAPAQLEIEKPIGRDLHNRKKISSRSRRTKPAVTRATRLEPLPLSTLLSVRIETGRTHQIRVHLSEAGFPVVGDRDYGRARRPPSGGEEAFRILKRLARPALHAELLGFDHPTSGAAVRFEAPVPDDIRAILEELRKIRRGAGAPTELE
jgi:23S rRNA pseudouridine1911/1915/1917 synthase